jgi:ubiquinone/menaquinone biosynthesis C-methylase UbiE
MTNDAKNEKNKHQYSRTARIYDWYASGLFSKLRKREFELAQIQPGQRVLVVGIGTGLDLPYLPVTAQVTGIDLSPEMLNKAKLKAGQHDAVFFEMNAERLEFDDETFDVIVMNLVLSIVGDPKRAISEANRVLKRSGSVWILHKEPRKPNAGFMGKAIKLLTSFAGGVDITFSIDELIGDIPLRKNYKEKGLLADIIQLTPY